jgi:PAS domain S-box-containing protein
MTPLKILFVEDSPPDLFLMVRSFTKAGLNFEYERVASIPLLKDALLNKWDILISDYHLPGFSALDVLDVVREKATDLPVIVISGAIQEEDAADLLRFGAKDFVRKDNHVRLVPAILRETQELKQRVVRRQVEEALQESQDLTKQIFQSIEDSILVLSTDGKIISANPSAARAFQLSASGEKLFTQCWDQVEDKKNVALVLKQARSGDVGKFVGLGRDSQQWWHVIVSPILSATSKIEKLLVVARDVTEELRRQEELKKALTQAESANKMKTSFLANMSHEIRTPVGAMMGFAELLSDENIASDQKAEFLKVIQRNGETLLRILNEILDLSKIEAGHLEIEKMDFSLKTTVDDVVTSLLPKAEAKGIRFSLHFDSSTPSVVHSDSTRLQQILTNLIGNAIKFTEKGEVGIHVSAKRQGNEEEVAFRITDSGLGISAEDQLKLFKPFSQSDNSISRRFGGTGLGLTLSKRFANALGGDVKIETSTPGKGTCFVATIRNDLGALAVAAHPPRGLRQNSYDLGFSLLNGYRILVAEDVQDNQDLLKQLLGKCGAKIEFVFSGREAVDLALEKKNFDLVLMDIQMPGMDGISAMRELRAKGFSKPIIALSAHAMKEYIDECLRSGFDGYISKPIDSKNFVKTLIQMTVNQDL